MVKATAAQRFSVILDVLCEDELLFLALANIGDQPVSRIRVVFDAPIVDAAGRDVTKLALFKRCEFLAPGRSIRTLLDSRTAYFQRRQPTRFTVQLSYREGTAAPVRHQITHDLSIYRTLALVQSRSSAPR